MVQAVVDDEPGNGFWLRAFGRASAGSGRAGHDDAVPTSPWTTDLIRCLKDKQHTTRWREDL